MAIPDLMYLSTVHLLGCLPKEPKKNPGRDPPRKGKTLGSIPGLPPWITA